MEVISSKNNTQVDSIFTLSSEITLQREIDSSTDKIEVIFPANVNYDINSIYCLSAQQNLNCDV